MGYGPVSLSNWRVTPPSALPQVYQLGLVRRPRKCEVLNSHQLKNRSSLGHLACVYWVASRTHQSELFSEYRGQDSCKTENGNIGHIITRWTGFGTRLRCQNKSIPRLRAWQINISLIYNPEYLLVVRRSAEGQSHFEEWFELFLLSTQPTQITSDSYISFFISRIIRPSLLSADQLNQDFLHSRF